MCKLLLASSSAYRQAQLAAIGIQAKAVAPDIDETPLADEAPANLARRLAEQKARKVAPLYPDHLTIGSDQVAVVTIDGVAHKLGKPGTAEKAREQLAMCAGKVVTFYTAVAVYKAQTQQLASATETVDVHFLPLSDEAIARYVDAEQPLDCAGSFKAEGRGALLFSRVTSRDPNTLIGLPVMLLRDLLAGFQVDLLALATGA